MRVSGWSTMRPPSDAHSRDSGSLKACALPTREQHFKLGGADANTRSNGYVTSHQRSNACDANRTQLATSAIN
jgi:hypothetical protein